MVASASSQRARLGISYLFDIRSGFPTQEVRSAIIPARPIPNHGGVRSAAPITEDFRDPQYKFALKLTYNAEWGIRKRKAGWRIGRSSGVRTRLLLIGHR